MIVRSALHRLGYRFRLHRRDLPGTPDIVLPRFRICILVHGCFWHQHVGCRAAALPKSRVDFWRRKLEQNVRRDIRDEGLLRAAGWTPTVIWECEAYEASLLDARLRRLLEADLKMDRASLNAGPLADAGMA